MQVILRGFGAHPAELVDGASIALNDVREVVIVPLAEPLRVAGEFALFSVEPCLIWEGDQPLRLARSRDMFGTASRLTSEDEPTVSGL